MSKLDDIVLFLKQRIESGHYPLEQRLPSEYELADELGVNRITLNKAMNRLIAEGYLRRGTSARDGTYVRDRSRLVNGTLGLLLRGGNIYADHLLHGMVDAATRNNYLLAIMSPEPEELSMAERKMVENNIAGVFIASYGQYHLSSPGVHIDSIYGAEFSCNAISSDVYTGGRQLVSKLVEHGHDEIVMVLSSSFPVAQHRRCLGVLHGMEEHGITDASQRFIYANHRSMESVLKVLFDTFPKTTAIIGETDFIIFDLWQSLFKAKSPLASTLAFAGFGNLPRIQSIFPFLTVDQSPYELGLGAVQLFLDWRADGQYHQAVVPVSLANCEYIPPPHHK